MECIVATTVDSFERLLYFRGSVMLAVKSEIDMALCCRNVSMLINVGSIMTLRHALTHIARFSALLRSSAQGS